MGLASTRVPGLVLPTLALLSTIRQRIITIHFILTKKSWEGLKPCVVTFQEYPRKLDLKKMPYKDMAIYNFIFLKVIYQKKNTTQL